MDKEFQTNADTTFTERHGNIIRQFKTENQNHRTLTDKITALKETIRPKVNGEIQQSFDELMKLLALQNYIETKCLYVQGIKDCIDLYYFLSTDFINSDYGDLIMESEDMNQC